MFDRRLLKFFDWQLLITVFVINIIGIIAIYSAASSYEYTNYYFYKQMIWFALGILIMAFITMIDYRYILKFSIIIHLLCIGLLIFVLFYDSNLTNVKVNRWFSLGPIIIQPSELVKLSLVLFLAYYFQDARKIGDVGLRYLYWPFIATIIPFILILKQPDLGTATLLFFIFIPTVFLVGIRYRILIVTIILSIITTPFAWFFLLKPYQQKRISSLFFPELDPLGTGYHIIQSKIAVGSGGVWGKGFLKGTQGQLNFLPARHTDFLFSMFCEEWGFIGGACLVCLYLFLIFQCLTFIGKTKDRSGSIITMGITSIIASHIFINIGMVIGILPVVGMPLPFFSYGGSSIITMMAGIGLVLNVRMRRFDL